MTLLNAIEQAKLIRPVDAPDKLLADWAWGLEAEFAETMQTTLDENPWPSDTELLMPAPYDEAYPLYLAARIDHLNEDFRLYANDYAIANAAVQKAKAWWRRGHIPLPKGVTI